MFSNELPGFACCEGRGLSVVSVSHLVLAAPIYPPAWPIPARASSWDAHAPIPKSCQIDQSEPKCTLL